MKTCVTRVWLVMIALFACSPLWASDVAGKWKADFETRDGRKLSNTFTFVVDGETLTGTVLSSVSGQEVAIQDGTLKGDDINFFVVRNLGGNDVKMKYSGKVAGDTISFTVKAGDGDQAFEIQMVAKREK
jgi:hypothetical protein